jgi:rhamnogalacturonyl hydrolase YesR
MSELITDAINRLNDWIDKNNWVGYDPFDGLSASFARRLTFESPILRIALQQSVRRLPFNIRPILGITKKHSNQAMGYFASGYLRLFSITGDMVFLDKAIYCLSDLMKNFSPGYAGYSWGWAFDYQSRGVYYPQGVPSVVWTSFISHAFIDAYENLSDPAYLEIARGACQFILKDLPRHQIDKNTLCISYIPPALLEIHNANMLAASVLARVYKHTHEEELASVAKQAVNYTMSHHRIDGSWFYGEGLRWRWVDGYHTGFVLDSLYWYMLSTGDEQYLSNLTRGMDYYRKNLFDGPIASHYDYSTYPIDIQSIAQAIQTFAFIPEDLHGDITWAQQVAHWAIKYMQDKSGYFYFRKLRHTTDKTPFLHWGQGTMLAALTLLLQRQLSMNNNGVRLEKYWEVK